MVPFITNTEFLQRFDGRWISQNLLDNGTVPSIASLQDITSPGGAVLAEMLSDASEMVMGAAAVGKRYTEDDLRINLVATPPHPGGGALLLRVVSNLAMGLILMRRGRAISDERALSGPYTDALAALEELRRGERVFWAVPLVPEAGLAAVAGLGPIPGIDPPTIVQLAGRYFGSVAGCYPYGQVQGLPTNLH